MTPTQRSLKHLRNGGLIAQVVEHWQAFSRRRIDLFSVIDIVALDISNGRTLGIQTTSGGCVSARINKIYAEPNARAWLQAGNRLIVHGWAKRGARGKRKLWSLREVEIVLDGEALITKED